MLRIVESLLEIQRIELAAQRLTPEQQTEAQQRRAKVPTGILESFDRWVGRGKKAVAIVRNGVCGECHLRLPSGTLAGLAYTTELHNCNNCGRFLFLPEDEPLGLNGPGTESARRPRQRGAASKAVPPAGDAARETLHRRG